MSSERVSASEEALQACVERFEHSHRNQLAAVFSVPVAVQQGFCSRFFPAVLRATALRSAFESGLNDGEVADLPEWTSALAVRYVTTNRTIVFQQNLNLHLFLDVVFADKKAWRIRRPRSRGQVDKFRQLLSNGSRCALESDRTVLNMAREWIEQVHIVARDLADEAADIKQLSRHLDPSIGRLTSYSRMINSQQGATVASARYGADWDQQDNFSDHTSSEQFPPANDCNARNTTSMSLRE